MKHTRGPWIADKHNLIIDGNNRAIATCYHMHGEGGANARLIAVAPELLEACKAIVDQKESTPNKDVFEVGRVSIERAKRAILKAKGGDYNE